MSEPFVGEVRMFGFNFAPRGWSFCNGQLIAIAQNTALFSLLGTTYGGNGTTTFGLPNLQGRFPMHWGSGPGLTNRNLGDTGGSPAVTLVSTQMPSHSHTANANSAGGNQLAPAGNRWAPDAAGANFYAAAPSTTMAAGAIGLAGGNQPHENMQPYLAVNFCIAMQGVFPSRN